MKERITRKVTKAQSAFLDWGEKHPYGRLEKVEFVDGDPCKWIANTEDGLGTELIRFDKIGGQNGH